MMKKDDYFKDELPPKGFCPDCMFEGDISKFARMSQARVWVEGTESAGDVGLGTCIECAVKERNKRYDAEQTVNQEWRLVAVGDDEGPFRDRYWELLRPKLVASFHLIQDQVEMQLEREETALMAQREELKEKKYNE